MTEALGEVAAVQRERPAGRLPAVADEPFELGDVGVELEIRPQAERVLADLEDRVRLHAGGGDARPDEPQRLAQGRRGWAVEVGPEVGGDRVAEAGTGAKGQQRGEGLGVAARESNGLIAGDDLEPSQQSDCQRRSCRRVGGHLRPPAPA